MRKALITLTAAAALALLPGTATAQQAPPAGCANNFFLTQQMWEITWGLQSEDDGIAEFFMSSYGGMTSVNGGPVPDVMINYSADELGWRWLYVTPAEVADGRTVTYGFADGTVITAEVTNNEGCPLVVWTTQAPGDEVPEDPTPEDPTPEDPAPTQPTQPGEVGGDARTPPPAALPVVSAPTFTG